MAYHYPARSMDGAPSYQSQNSVHAPAQRAVPDVPGTVTSLINATKRLEYALPMWAACEISETEISDMFVAVGNCFHEMLAAFSAYHIDMQDVANFLQDLRKILEECLSEEPSPQITDFLMPQVRTIIAALLIGLRNKTSLYWESARHTPPNSGSGSRSSTGSAGSAHR